MGRRKDWKRLHKLVDVFWGRMPPEGYFAGEPGSEVLASIFQTQAWRDFCEDVFHDFPDCAEPNVIVDEGDAPYVPCPCPMCVEGDDLPDDIDYPSIIRYEVFFQ